MATSTRNVASLPFDNRHYVPCLRWKQGEYQALLRLTEDVKSHVTPIVEVPEIGFDFENRKEAKNIDEHLSNFGKRVKGKWGDRLCFVDLKLLTSSLRMADGTHPLDFVFQDLKVNGCSVIPVTSIDRDQFYQESIKQIVERDQRGVCFRATIQQAANQNFAIEAARVLTYLNLQKKEVDLVLDLGAPNFSPVAGFEKLIVSIVRRIPELSRWRTFVILGTAFPSSMAEITGGGGSPTRSEWVLFRGLTNDFRATGLRLPTFGDYAVSHPDVLLADMRIIKPYATIRYTINDAWWILKGLNVRDNGFAQYRSMCSRLIRSNLFMGPDFSAGDLYIRDCARGNASTGNLTTWRWVGTNHHIHKVVENVANLSDASNMTSRNL